MMRRDRPPAFISSPARMKKGTASSGKLSKPACRFCASSCESKRSEEHTSELQSRLHLVCRLLLEKKKKHDRREQWMFPSDHRCRRALLSGGLVICPFVARYEASLSLRTSSRSDSPTPSITRSHCW